MLAIITVKLRILKSTNKSKQYTFFCNPTGMQVLYELDKIVL